MGTDYCPECRAVRKVEDVHTESAYRGGSGGAWEESCTVVDLDCGHAVQSRPVVSGPAPGAPYAGPRVAVAATHHLPDLRAARARQVQIDADPWSDR